MMNWLNEDIIIRLTANKIIVKDAAWHGHSFILHAIYHIEHQ